MLKAFSLLVSLVAFAPAAQSAERFSMEANDAVRFANVMRSASGIESVDYARVACRTFKSSPASCTYEHRNGAKDSFSWWKFRSAVIAEILHKYGEIVSEKENMRETAIYNVLCDQAGCTFE